MSTPNKKRYKLELTGAQIDEILMALQMSQLQRQSDRTKAVRETLERQRKQIEERRAMKL